MLRPQRLAAPVRVYIEAFSAHPLEADAAELYAAPDGWLDAGGQFHSTEPEGGGTPVHVAELRPEDGPLPLPYMARQADGSAWEDATTVPLAPAALSRQTFYPDASRIYEEIDRLGVDGDGRSVRLSAIAGFDFYRPAPSGGWTKGLPGAQRADTGAGDIAPELLGEDYFVYYPPHPAREPTLVVLARATTTVQTVLEGSPTNEETMYWFGLLVDTPLPLVGHSAQRPHQSLSADGDRNIVDGVKYIASGVALDAEGPDRIGAVMLVDGLVFTAREIIKTDARPGGCEATGGHGGVVADMGGYGPPEVTFLPARRHTWCSDLRLTVLPDRVGGVTGSLAGGIRTVDVPVKDEEGGLLPSAMPVVTITEYSRYTTAPTSAADLPDLASEVEVLARTAANLEQWPLSGFVEEGMSPYGVSDPTTDAALTPAVFAGMARMLLMAALLKFGALPPAADPARPTAAEQAATEAAVAAYQAVFDTH